MWGRIWFSATVRRIAPDQRGAYAWASMSIQAQGNLYWLTVGRNRAVGLGLGLGTASGRRVRGRTEVSEAEVVEECRGHLAGDRLLQHRLHVPGVDHRGGLLPERELRHRPTDHAGRRCSSGVLFNGAVHQQEVVPRPERAQREPQRPGDRQPPSELRPPHRHGPEQPCHCRRRRRNPYHNRQHLCCYRLTAVPSSSPSHNPGQRL